MQRSRLGAHDDLIEATKKNVGDESGTLQTELKGKIGEVRARRPPARARRCVASACGWKLLIAWRTCRLLCAPSAA